MKKCPFCAEKIQDEAVRCRYCRSDLPKPAPLLVQPPGAVPSPGLKARPAPRPDRYPVPAPGLSPAQVVFVAIVVLVAGYILLRGVYVSEKSRVRAGDMSLPLLRVVPEPAERGYMAAPDEFRRTAPRYARPSPEPEVLLEAGSAGVGDDSLRRSQQYYLSGLIYYQKGDYAKSRREWELAVSLDPGNTDAKAGLERLRNLAGPK